MIIRGTRLLFLNIIFMVIVISFYKGDAGDTRTASRASVLNNRPKYTELQRPKKVTSTTEPPEFQEEEDDDEPPPRIMSNGRGGKAKDETSKESDADEAPQKSRGPQSSGSPSTTTIASVSGKRNVEYLRPGATKRPKTRSTTTRAPKKQQEDDEEEGEKEDKNARPNGCSQCRFYCKQCKGAEEVTSGGVWGCCNHNCCGGRCSCQKIK